MNSVFSIAMMAAYASAWLAEGPVAYDDEGKKVVSLSHRYDWEVDQATKQRHYNMSFIVEMHEDRELSPGTEVEFWIALPNNDIQIFVYDPARQSVMLQQLGGWSRPVDVDGNDELKRLRANEPYMFGTTEQSMGSPIPAKNPEEPDQAFWFDATVDPLKRVEIFV